MSDTPAVAVTGLTKDFGVGETRVQALRGVDLAIDYGKMTLLVGPSGCGKTTLVSIIAGLLEPTTGAISVLGQPLHEMCGRKKTLFRGASIGFVFQQYHLMPTLTAEENAAIPLIILGQPRRLALQTAGALLDKLELGNRRHALPRQLSGGQQQRVAIARALVHQPRLLICDEPTAALDAHSGQHVIELLRDVALQEGRSVIIVTHDNRIYKYADRIAEMSDGQMVNGASESHFAPGRH